MINEKPIPTVAAGEVLSLGEKNSLRTNFCSSKAAVGVEEHSIRPFRAMPKEQKDTPPGTDRPLTGFFLGHKRWYRECACKSNLRILQSTAEELRSKCPVLSG